MRKTLLVTYEYPPDVGGIARYLENVVSNVDVGSMVVLAPSRPDSPPVDTRGACVVYRRKLIAPRWVWPRWIATFVHTIRIIRREHIERVVVSHVLPAGTVAWLLRWWKPYWVIVHGMDVAVSSARKRRLIRSILNCATGIIVNSAFTQSLVEQYSLTHRRLWVVPPGVDLTDTAATPNDLIVRQRAALEERHALRGNPVLLTVARLVPRKGIDTVLEALALLREQYPTLTYLIVGTGPEEEHLRELAKALHSERQAVFVGYVPDRDLPRYFERADVFVMVPHDDPSDVEGFGIVYLEANACAKPVIGSTVGGVREAVIDQTTGLLVPPGNASATAYAIASLLDDPAYARSLGIQGKTRVLNQFRWELQAEKFRAALEGQQPVDATRT